MARCHNCGHSNSQTALFCIKCATELGRTQAKLARARQIFLPPQEDSIVRPQSINRPAPRSNFAGLWLVGLLILVGILVWFYGR